MQTPTLPLKNSSECINPSQIQPVRVTAHPNPTDLKTGSIGSGFMLDSELGDGYFVTNAHVVLQEKYGNETLTNKNWKGKVMPTILVIDSNNKRLEVEVVALVKSRTPHYFLSGHTVLDDVNDIAILKAKHYDLFKDTFKATKHKLANPEAKGNALQTGYSSRIKTGIRDYNICLQYIHQEAVVYTFDGRNIGYKMESGSGIFNSKGEVIAINARSGGTSKTIGMRTFVNGTHNNKLYLRYFDKDANKPLPIYGIAVTSTQIQNLINEITH